MLFILCIHSICLFALRHSVTPSFSASLQPAIANPNDFGPAITDVKLTLLRDVTVTDAPLTVNNDLLLDLAGFDISGSINGALLEVATDGNITTGNLTITDSSTGKTGRITNTSTETDAVGVRLTADALTTDSPQTGDNTNVPALFVLMFSSLAAMFAVIFGGKKKKKAEDK